MNRGGGGGRDLRTWFAPTTSTTAKSEPAAARTNVPYLLSFQWPFGEYARFPGSGDFAFDSIRNLPDKYSGETSEFGACLRQVVLSSTGLTEYGELRESLLGGGLGDKEWRVLAWMFYKRNTKWCRTDKLKGEALDLMPGYFEESTMGEVDCLDLFTIEELLACFPQPNKPKSKPILIQTVRHRTYPHACWRIHRQVFAGLARMHQYVFCDSLLEPEDAVCIISSFKRIAATIKTTTTTIHATCWDRLKQALDWLEDMSAVGVNGTPPLLELACAAYVDNSQTCKHACNLHRKRLDVLQRLIWGGVSSLEKQRKYSEAVKYLQQVVQGWDMNRCEDLDSPNPCTRGAFFIGRVIYRLCLDWSAHLQRPVEALELLERVLREENLFLTTSGNRNRLGGVGMSLIQYALRLSQPPRRWNPKLVYAIRPMPERHFTLVKQAGKRVEHSALEAYKHELGYTHGMHCENGIAHTLFGVLFLCQPVGFNDFVLVSNPTECLLRVECELDQFLMESWHEKFPSPLRGVNWHRNSLQELGVICRALGASCVAAICRLFLDAYEAWCGGVGDLLVWSPDHHARFVEVKGPGDSLSDRQRAWGEKLLEAGAEVEVCYVEWAKPPSPKRAVVVVL
ncbi:hypothetical protein BASA81_005753 [Batrachochytrium salamandrivorans]|nr:hypothetical protein BASA81_005753 [Batrachochytrium salamandrivorans]